MKNSSDLPKDWPNFAQHLQMLSNFVNSGTEVLALIGRRLNGGAEDVAAAGCAARAAGTT